ncbi:hypothetical protein KP509_13G074300 [Ceratopteris richardii]|uniref:HMA domain-containing protein n=1 Tax=Ceratopteris richardii TaxID=49495 RepID=A0A8T2TEP7_CERRI|nr:hypothetical protein KP509_13G074300 [Ceratopteris richardii]
MRIPTLHHLIDAVKLNFSNQPGADAVEAVDLRVHMDCPGCERVVRKALSRLKGIHSIEIDRAQQKVTVRGIVDKRKVLNRVRRKGKLAELWPDGNAYNAAAQIAAGPEMAIGAAEQDLDTLLYDRPLHYSYVNGGQSYDDTLINAMQAHHHPHGPIADAFNDDNPNNCRIM